MKLFDAAYVRLTGWYVAIIMIISLLFSVWVYTQARQELSFGLNRIVQVGPFDTVPAGGFRNYIDDRLDDSRHRVIVRLVELNVAVLIIGAAASYWLARRTMRPIEEAMEAQHRFTADASHELRTPLAAMKAEIEVGLRDKQLSKAEAMELLQSNLEEIDRLGGLADGLLTLTQTDQRLAPQPVSLEEAAAAVARRLAPLAEAKEITVTKELPPVVVRANLEATDKIIGILLDNAIKYSPEHTMITIRSYQKDGHGFVEVADQGIGIKASELPHIFERFYRADSSRAKVHAAGHGLGLSIAKSLAEAMDGDISAVSTAGKGSVFTVKLPVGE